MEKKYKLTVDADCARVCDMGLPSAPPDYDWLVDSPSFRCSIDLAIAESQARKAWHRRLLVWSAIAFVLAAILLLTGCGLTSQGDAIRAALADKGATAMDAGVENALWFLCKAASVGSINREFEGERAEAYKKLCAEPPAVLP